MSLAPPSWWLSLSRFVAYRYRPSLAPPSKSYKCPEPEVRAHRAANTIANFGFKRGTRIMELLVVLRFRSSYLNVPRVLTNFGIGPLERVPFALTRSRAETRSRFPCVGAFSSENRN